MMPRITPGSASRIVLTLLAGCLVALALAAGVFRAEGGRWFVVSSPSMGRTAPVGTMVLTTPGTPRIGEIISFRPNGGNRIYTHRIVAVTADGGYQTKGDINGAQDPWTVTRSQVIGVVIARLPGAGFLLRALPWLVLGWLLVWLLTAKLGASGREPARVVGSALVFSGVALWLHPWVDVEPITYYPQGGGVTAQVVSTGILPIRVTAVGGTSTDLVAGQVGTVHTDVLGGGRLVQIVPHLQMGPWWWFAVVVFCLLPLLACVIVGVPAAPVTVPRHDDDPSASSDPPDAEDPPSPPPGADGPGRSSLLTALATVSVALLLSAWVLHPTPAHAAFTASIANSGNTLGTGTWADCAATDTATAGVWGVYPLDNAAGKSQPDLTNQHPARRSGKLATSSSSGCAQGGSVGATFDGSSSCGYVPTRTTGPDTFSLEAWFNTTTTSNGKLIGFGTSTNVSDTNWDRQIYLDPAGRVVFGVYPGAVETVASPAGVDYADGQWHHVIATLSSAGMALYLDGTLVAANHAVTSAQGYSGYWKIGCGRLQGWAAGNGAGYSGPDYYTGSLSYVAVYTTALSATQVLQHFDAGRA